MKTIYIILSIICFLFVTNNAFSQDNIIHQASCSDAYIEHEVDSLKEIFSKQGFIVVKEFSMAMESEYEMHVIMPLTEGTWYQFVFIGDITSKLYEVRMYDWSEKEVVYQKKLWGDVDGNIISYSYIPKSSEYHIMKPLQVNKKKKKLCSYVMLFKKIK